MAPPRPSSYRRSYTPDNRGNDPNYYLVNADTKAMKEQEREQMKTLNNRLVSYIDKVHDLEQANKMLAAENAKLRRLQKEPETDVAAIYEDELKRLRIKVEHITTNNVELQLERDNAYYDRDDAVVKLEETYKSNKDLEKEVQSLRKDVDDATVERANMEAKVESQQEQMVLEKQVHEAEMENIRRQVQPVNAPVLHTENDSKASLLPDLNDTISKVRRQYEAFNAKSLEDLDMFYKEKVENLNRQLKSTQDDIRQLRAENAEKRREIQRLEMELDALRGKKNGLEKTLQNLEERTQNESKEKDDLLDQLRKELDNTKQDMGKYLKDYQDLNTLKLSLDQEIAIYRKLITGEETRLSEVDTTVTSTRSRSSSRSSSSDSSRESSRERSKGVKTKVIEEMLEEKNQPKQNAAAPKPDKPKADKPQTKPATAAKPPTDVISVSWKVKGGTVRPVNPFNPDADAEALRKAMKGLGTDEETIINILSNRTKDQRDEISKRYMAKYKDNLLKELEGELSGNLKATVQHLMWKHSVLDAQAIRKAIKGLGTDEAVLIEILCTQSSREINDIKKDYNELFKRDLVNDVKSETSGGFKAFLLAILKCARAPDSGTVVADEAESDAKQLYAIGVKNWNPANPTFLNIFTQRSYQHLWYLFKQCWSKLTKENLLDEIDKQCRPDLKRGLKTIIRFSTCIPPEYYAIQAHEALAVKGTEDKQLIYIITTRCEIDLIDIKEEYLKLYKMPLPRVVQDETSGNYKKMLVALMH